MHVWTVFKQTPLCFIIRPCSSATGLDLFYNYNLVPLFEGDRVLHIHRRRIIGFKNALCHLFFSLFLDVSKTTATFRSTVYLYKEGCLDIIQNLFLFIKLIHSPYPFADGHCLFRHGLWVGHIVLHDRLEELVLVLTIKRRLEINRSGVRQYLQWWQFIYYALHSEVKLKVTLLRHQRCQSI